MSFHDFPEVYRWYKKAPGVSDTSRGTIARKIFARAQRARERAKHLFENVKILRDSRKPNYSPVPKLVIKILYYMKIFKINTKKFILLLP